MARRSLAADVGATPALGVWLPILNAESHLSWLDLMDGRLAEAQRRAAEAVAWADRRAWSTVYQVAPAYLTLAVVAVERGDLAESARQIDQVSGTLRSWPEVGPSIARDYARARMWTAAGRPDEALTLLGAARLSPATTPTTPFLDRLLAIAQAEALAALDLHDQAVALLRTSDAVGRPVEALFRARQEIAAGRPNLAVDLLVEPAAQLPLGRQRAISIRRKLWLARAYQLIGHRARAVSRLRIALELAHHEGFRTPFRELGPHAGRLLELARPAEMPGGEALIGELRSLVASAGASEDMSAVNLTPRERELLVLLPSRMTYDEIAASLHVSVNTVKTHLQAVYRKLDAPNRRQAVRRAERIGLL